MGPLGFGHRAGGAPVFFSAESVEVVRCQHRALTQDHGPFDHVFQLPHVAGPAVPYGTVFLDWHREVLAAEAAGGDRNEEICRRLAYRIRGLMETLCGEHAG